MTADERFVDDPAKDYRRRYRLPDQFVWDVADWPRIDFDGYTALALDLLPEPPGRVLDVGSGPGAGAARLVERGYDVTGVDYNERAVGFARLMVEPATFVLGDIRALDEVDELGGGFDAAWCIEVLEHIPPRYRREVLAGTGRRLRPGGTFVLTTPTPRMHGNVWGYPRAILADLIADLDASGFGSIDVRYQHRLGTLFSPNVWRLISNGAYDVRAARRLLRRLFLRRWNAVAVEGPAGRYVIRAVRGAP